VAACATAPGPTEPAQPPTVAPAAAEPARPAASPTSILATTPQISVQTGLEPRLTPDEVTAEVLKRIRVMERVAGHAVRPARILSIRASSGAWGIQWEVRAEGTFIAWRPGRRTDRPDPVGSGHFVISDSDGLVVEYGLP